MRVAVVGSGTAGATAALFLARDGHNVELFERTDPRPVGVGEQTSLLTRWTPTRSGGPLAGP